VSDSTSTSTSDPLETSRAQVLEGRSGVSRLPCDARLPRVGTHLVAEPGEFSWPSVGSSRWPWTLRLIEPAHQIRPGALQIGDSVSEIGVVRCRGGHRSGRRSLRSRHRGDDRSPAEKVDVLSQLGPVRPRDRTPLQARVENDTSAYSSGPHGCGQAPISLPNAWSSRQEPKTARCPRIARLSPGPHRVGPPCARQRRVAASLTRTAGCSRSRAEARVGSVQRSSKSSPQSAWARPLPLRRSR